MTAPTVPPSPPAGIGPDGRPRTRSSKLVLVLVTLACIVVAGAAVKFAPELTEADVRRGTVGQTMQFYKSQVRVTGIRAGTEIPDEYDESATKSKGLLLAITLELDAPEEKERIDASSLHAAGDRVYRSIESASMSVPPGFRGTTTFVYEVDPAQMDDLYLEIADGEIFYSYPQVLRISLGITSKNAQAWQKAAAGQPVEATQFPELEALT